MTFEQCWHRVPGGTAVAAIETARALGKHDGWDLIGVSALHRAKPEETWEPPIEVRSLPLPRNLLYESWNRLRRPRVDLVTGKVTVIHATSIAVPPRSAPIVVSIHDLAFVHDPSHFTARGLSFFRGALEVARREADLVLCSTRTVMEDCEANGFDPSRLRLVPLGVDAEPVDAEHVREVRARHGVDDPYVMWAGTVEPRKNLENLVTAFDRLDTDRALVLAGPRGWNEDLDRIIGRIRPRVHALGFVPRGDLAALYAGADAFCFPSLREGFGLPVLEAMAQGTPVVTSSGTATEEVAGDAAVLVDPTDPESIANGLRTVLNDAHLRARLAAAGPARAAEFTWERTADLVIGCYEEVAA